MLQAGGIRPALLSHSLGSHGTQAVVRDVTGASAASNLRGKRNSIQKWQENACRCTCFHRCAATVVAFSLCEKSRIVGEKGFISNGAIDIQHTFKSSAGIRLDFQCLTYSWYLPNPFLLLTAQPQKPEVDWRFTTPFNA